MKYKFINKCVFFFFFFFISTAILSTTASAVDATRKAACATTAATIDIHDSTASGTDVDECETQPDTQTIKIHKISLCTSSPTAPTTTTILDRSMCSEYFSNDAGAIAKVVEGKANNIEGTISDIPSGTYTHALIEMGTSFSYTSVFNFTANATDIAGGNASTTCVTKASSFTPMYNTADTNGELVKSNITCADVAATAATIVINSLDWDGNTTCVMTLDYSGTTGTIPAFLTKSDGKLASTTCNGTSANSVDRVVGFLPIDIKWVQGAGQTVRIKYNNTRGIEIQWSNTNRVDRAQISFFDFSMTSRAPKKRSFR